LQLAPDSFSPAEYLTITENTETAATFPVITALGQFRGKITGPLKYRELIKLLEANGWHLHRQSGSHMIFRRATGPGVIVVAGGENKTATFPKERRTPSFARRA